MAKTVINAGPEFLFARLHGLWARSLHGDALHTLIRAENEDHLMRLLRDHGFEVESYGSFHRSLKLRELADLDDLRAQAEPAAAVFLRAFMRRTWYDNLKALLHYYFFKERTRDIDRLVVDVPTETPLDKNALRKAATVGAFIAALHLPADAAAVVDCIRALAADRDKDIVLAESTLDRLCFHELMEAAGNLPSGLRKAAVSLVGHEIDIINIGTMLRLVRTYRFEPPRASQMWLEDGALLPAKVLTELAQSPDAAHAIALLPPLYRHPLEPLALGDLYLLENRLRNSLYQEAMRIFRNTEQFDQVLVGYLYLRHFETVNVGRVFEGIHFGVQPKDLFDMLIS